MKKLLSTIMALVMLLSLVPMAVAEEGEAKWSETESEKHVAQVGNMYYEVLDDAVAAVEPGGTVKLVKDVELSKAIVIGSTEAKTLVLDLGGKTLKGNIDFYAGDLTVQNGTVEGIVYANATNTDVEYGHLTIANDAVIRASYAVILYQKDYGANNFGSTIDVYGTLKGNLWVMGNITTDLATAANPCVVNVHDGAVIEAGEDNVGIAVQGAAKVTVGKAKITAENGIEVRAGELTVNGATVEATAKEFSCDANNSGTTTVGAAIAISQHTTKKNIAVTINGGSFTGVKALNESNPQKNDPAPQVDLSINGGTFNGGISTADVTGFIKGGAFTDLANAVKYAADGATITLAGDAKGDIVIPADKTITLDLNGKTLTNVKDHTIVNNGALTITGTGTVDNVTNGKAALVNYGTATLNGGNFTRSRENPENNKDSGGGNSYYTILNDKGATMTINEGVTVSNVGHFSSMIRNGGDDETNAVSTMIINGGTFSGGINTVKNDECGVLTIKGGDFSNTSQYVIMNWNKATISDGMFEANASAEAVLFTAKYLANRAVGELKIEGGTYVCAENQKLIVDRYKNNDQYLGTAVISAGAFNVAPDAKYLAEGMIVVPGVKDATYTVQPATREDENTKTEVEVDGDKVTTTVTDKTTGTTTETVTDTKTGAETKTVTESKTEGNVTTKTETVTETAADGTTKTTESKIVENNENGNTTTKTTVDGTTVKTNVTVKNAPAAASDVTLDATALDGKAAGTDTASVTVDKASLSELKNDTVKNVIIETDQATLKLDKTAVKAMEGKVAADGKMTMSVKLTEEKNASKTEINKIVVEVNAVNEADQNVFPKDTEKTNGTITITIPYTGTETQLDLWYAADSGSIYMGRFPVVDGFASFDVNHFSQYDLIPVASSGSGVASGSSSSGTHTVTTDLTPGSITKVTVDGKVVDAKYYTVSGSDVTFTAEFLKTLKNGSHTVTVENATRIAKGVFTVNNPVDGAKAPTTADAGIALYAGMAIASVMGTGVVFTSRKRKNH